MKLSNKMNIKRFINCISVFVLISGLVVMVGWYLDIDFVKSFLPGAVTMKFSTALCFSLSGLSLLFIARTIEGKTEVARWVLSNTSFTILLIMLTFLISTIMGLQTDLEVVFVTETEAVMTSLPGRPSLGTTLGFILIAFCGILVMINKELSLKVLPILGAIVGFLGVLAILGYLLNISLLYCYIEGLSTAMAFHTAALFILLGLGLMFVVRIR